MHRWFIFFVAALLLTTNACKNEHKNDEHQQMPVFQFGEATIDRLQQGYKNGDFTIREVVGAYLDRIKAIDKSGSELHAVIEVNPDALQIAEALDKEMQEGKIRGPMHGMPVILKDNIDTHDQMATTAGSRALAGSHPSKDSWVAKKFREAGAVIIAKANLSEWANFRGHLSSSGWSGIGGQCKNPYDLSRNPCGSSAGSGASVSANFCVVSIGTETNGSIMCPSSSNGVVGIKPTVGLISRSGIVPISFTQDTPGPMARTVRDAAICMGVLTGVDGADSKTLLSEGKSYGDYTQFLKTDGLSGKKIGIYTRPLGEHYKVDELFEKAVEKIKSLGAEVVEVDQLYPHDLGRWSFTVLLYEFKDGLNQYLVSLGAGAPVKSLKEIIEFNRKDSVELKYFGQQILEMAEEKGGLDSPEYREALAKMLENSREKGLDRVMDSLNLDAIIAPTGGPAWKTDHVNGDAFHVGSSSPAAIAGYPNITVPMGYISGLPVGISFFGRAWNEPQLLGMAYAFEQATHVRRAPEFLKGIAD